MPVYFDTAELEALAEKIARLEPCPVAGRVTADQVKIALGEGLDVWPARIAEVSCSA